MKSSSDPWVATVFLFEGKIYVWIDVGEPSSPPGKVAILDHLTQRAGEPDGHYFYRVNRFARAEAARHGAEVSVTLEPETAPLSN